MVETRWTTWSSPVESSRKCLEVSGDNSSEHSYFPAQATVKFYTSNLRRSWHKFWTFAEKVTSRISQKIFTKFFSEPFENISPVIPKKISRGIQYTLNYHAWLSCWASSHYPSYLHRMQAEDVETEDTKKENVKNDDAFSFLSVLSTIDSYSPLSNTACSLPSTPRISRPLMARQLMPRQRNIA